MALQIQAPITEPISGQTVTGTARAALRPGLSHIENQVY